MSEQIQQYLCLYCGRAIPGEVSSRPCAQSPDLQHRRGAPWSPPEPPLERLTPYDTGDRLEPHRWRERPDQPKGYGKVDFEDDESATVATVHIERTPAGKYRLVIETDFEFEEISFNGEATPLADTGDVTGTSPLTRR